MKIKALLILTFFAIVVVGTLIVQGCCSKSSQESLSAGPAEKAGAKIDKAVDNAKDETNKLVEKTGEIIEKTGDAIKKTGADIKDGE